VKIKLFTSGKKGQNTLHLRSMVEIIPGTLPTAKLHGLMLASVAPRPIAFASTIDASGRANLSPFSFFNVFSANPPIMVFSPARRVRDNTTKHTLENVKVIPEVVINVVNYALVQQCSLSSTEYPEGVDEFVKSGLTPIPSVAVKPFRVKESPVQYECKVNEVIALGNEGGAGNLIVCEVVRMHIAEEIMDERGGIDQHKIDLVARIGGDWYCRASGNALFTVPKPLSTLGIGVDALPTEIKNSHSLTGNDLGMLGNIEKWPDAETANQMAAEKGWIAETAIEALHLKARTLLSAEQVQEAACLLKWNQLHNPSK
jgi:flavin reductase (DIM6/NTAB) family NADH-FMN oxidoreductase RutF